MRALVAQVTAILVTAFARIVTAVRAEWIGCRPDKVQRIYYANHSSHGDTVLIWAILPRGLKAITRPVAGADYWLKNPLRRFIAEDIFNAILIDRTAIRRNGDPLQPMTEALAAGASLIIFPEGTRNTTEAPLLPFKGGIFHLARAQPQVELVPVYIRNLKRVLPKGEILPIPLACSVMFGTPIRLHDGETKKDFLVRTRDALLALNAGRIK
jgi:1-acyl-sn-glycerol-3-phosphate acyltransferase